MMEQHTQFMLFRRQQQIRNRGIIRSITVLQSVKYWTESNCELVFNSFRMARMLLPGIVDRWCVWKLEFPEKSCSSWRPPSRFTYNHCKVLVMNQHVSSWDTREVIDSILWWVFHLVRSRISLTFFSSRINNTYYFSRRGFFFLKHDCYNRWEWKQTCKNSTLYN